MFLSLRKLEVQTGMKNSKSGVCKSTYLLICFIVQNNKSVLWSFKNTVYRMNEVE